MGKNLQLFNDKRMTVKQIAEVLGVSKELIIKRVKELFPDKMKHGLTTYLNEVEVTQLSLRIKENSSLTAVHDRTQLASMPKTDLEKALIIQQAAMFQQEMINNLTIENTAQKAQLEQQKPAVEFFDSVTNSKTAIEMKKVAKVLDLGIGRNKLFEILRLKGVLMKNNEPYQKYIDLGYFRVIEQKYSTPEGETHISIKTLVYQKGVDYIRKTVRKGLK